MHDKYWIDPEGNIAEVGERHIVTIIEKPEAFGLTKAYIVKVHKKHHEKPGQEGDAREEILTKLMDKGWIRLRYVDSGDSWGIQVSEKSPIPYKSRIKAWAKFIIRDAPPGRLYSTAKILNLVPALIEPEFTLSEIAAGALEERRKGGQFAEFLNPAYGTVRRRSPTTVRRRKRRPGGTSLRPKTIRIPYRKDRS